ncbi:MAG: PAS domain S-box protein [Myxococcales bacterium FL481]|nr:MAG: PAS domain S-box protein [Myxococcales bacterium FL481]
MSVTPESCDQVSASSQYVVGIGASAGGLESLERLLSATPSDTGMAFVLILHLSPDHASLMTELLEKRTDMPVRACADGERVDANTVYVIQPGTNLEIHDGQLRLTERNPLPGRPNMPIDQFFRSLALDYEEHAVAVVLSGTGSDGTIGVRSVKQAGGLVFVQDPTEARFDGMPGAAINTCCADSICKAAEIPGEIVRLITALGEGTQACVAGEHSAALRQVIGTLRNVTRIDFSAYKPGTIARRVERRRRALRCDTLSDYVEALRRSDVEPGELVGDLLIGVTRFFRDASVWSKLRDLLMSQVATSPATEGPYRVWVAGCSTGEEAYTTAMVVSEALHHAGVDRAVKVFATDVHQHAIDAGARAVYPASVAADVPGDLLHKYFHAHSHGFEAKPALRDLVVFARHDILADPPFTRLDLVTCRNMLIYLRPSAQNRALQLLRFGLHDGGVLLLGASETPADETSGFVAIDRLARLYRAKPGFVRAPGELRTPKTKPSPSSSDRNQERPRTLSTSTGMSQDVLEALVQRLDPPCLVLSPSGELLYNFGNTHRYLRMNVGRTDWDARKLVPEAVSLALAAGLESIRDDATEYRIADVTLEGVEARFRGDLRVSRLDDTSHTPVGAAVFFDHVESLPTEDTAVVSADLSDAVRDRVRQLELELKRTRDSLQVTNEELQAANAELQATNEELLSSNEELQSTNEELQSLNEELHTVNSELQAKLEELGELTDDLETLLQHRDTGVLFLDADGRIRRFNRAICDLVSITEHDRDRPLSHFSHRFRDFDPVGEFHTVRGSCVAVDRRVDTHDGRWFIVRLQPIRTNERQVDGVVLTTHDITDIVESSSQLAIYRNAVLRSPLPYVFLDANATIVDVNGALAEQSLWSRNDLVGRPVRDVVMGTEAHELEQLAARPLSHADALALRVTLRGPDGRAGASANASCFLLRDAQAVKVVCAFGATAPS